MRAVPRKKRTRNNHCRGLIPLRDAMSRIFDEALWNPFGFMPKDSFLDSFLTSSKSLNLPSVDVLESEKKFTIEADIPGFSTNDIDIELNGNILTLRGKKEEKKEEDDKTYHLRERKESNWERSFTLPTNADLKKIACVAKDGKLTISIPKSGKNKNRKLSIKVK